MVLLLEGLHIDCKNFTTYNQKCQDMLTFAPQIQAVSKCCNTLNERLAPIKTANPGADWPTLIKAAFTAGVDLAVRAQ